MARIQTRTARKEYECGKCHRKIQAGETYKWVKPGFRSRTKIIRCSTCQFKQSELTTSKMSSVYSTLEDAEEALDRCLTVVDIEEVLGQCTDDLEEVGREYEEAAENFGGQGESAERAEAISQAVRDIQNWAAEDGPPGCSTHEDTPDPECNICADQAADWLADQIESAKDILQSITL